MSAGQGALGAGGAAGGTGVLAVTGVNSLLLMVIAAGLMLAGLVLLRIAVVGRRSSG